MLESARRFAFILAASAAIVPVDLAAQDADTVRLEAMVISATKSPVSRESLPQAVTVITGAELRARGITRVSDALQSVPGAMVVQNGSTGSVTSLFLRGGESRYTRVLLDGVSVNAPGGFFDFSHLTTDNVERIEIVRGPASVVHGADAVAGTVRIFTREGKGPLALRASGRAGSLATREGTLELGGSSGIARYALGAGARRTDGVLDFNNQYYNGTLSGSLGLKPGRGSDVLLSSRYGAAEFHYPTDYTGAPVDSNSYRVQHRLTGGVEATAPLTSALQGRLALGSNEVWDLTEDIGVPFGASAEVQSALRSRHKRRSVEPGVSLSLPALGLLNVGGELVHERESSVAEEGPIGGPANPTSTFGAERSNVAGYAELIGMAAGSSYTIGVRRDDNSDYGVFKTWRAGVNVPLAAGLRVRGSVSTAFNAPAFNQVRATLYTVASPDLRPERSRAWEVAAEASLIDGTMRVSGGYFAQRFSDLIQYVGGGPPSFLGSYDNLTEAESNGYEVEIAAVVRTGLRLDASYTNVRPRVSRVSSDYTGDLRQGDKLLRRPEHSGAASASWLGRLGTLGIAATYVGERPDMDFSQFPAPVVTLPAHTRVDAAFSRSLLRSASGRHDISLNIRVENVLDAEYEDVLRFRAPGRVILIGASVSGGP